jgi:alkanesulfonate monooxygenase SsuD/methylene tetrahydromethanopterin reductase-like flavin-dependent oxidoreductase (luciferase family)
MKGYVLGRNRDELRERIVRVAEVAPRFAATDPDALLEEARGRMFVGTPEEVVAQMRPFAEAGVERFMLQHFLLDDRDELELLASEVAPPLGEVTWQRSA